MVPAIFLALLLAPVDLDGLAAEYFKADAERQAAILREIGDADRICAADVAGWREKLLKLARKNGPKLKKSGTGYWYDKKEKRGKYMVGGSGGGKGGLVIALHGGGKGAGNAGSAHSTFAPIAGKHRCICISPEVLEKTEHGWTTSGTEEFLLELIEAAKRTWKIPHDRVYMVGHSMGGYGSWTVGAHHADLFAGLGPYAGGPTPYTVDGKPYGEVTGLREGVVPNLRNVALHIYQSLDDKNVPPAPNIFASKLLIEMKREHGGYNYKYVEVDGRGHGAPPGGHKVGFKWLYQFERETRPKYVLWEPVLSYKRMFYWLWWERPVANAVVIVRITKPNEITVDLGGQSLDGFKLLLDDELVDLSKEVVVKDDGGEVVFKGKVPYTLSTMLMTAAEKYDTGMLFPARIDLK
ncbi:MAG: hypothetical protein O7C98_01595 [Planctomycetota bacterium]|nr:hypothetical protein [Planctomycetota bacterium]